MRERTLYTSVGRLSHQKNPQGIHCPVIQLRNREYQLDLQELIVWTCLNWRILRKAEIAPVYLNLAEDCPHLPDRTLEDCIQRLMVRGLIVSGSGDTEYDALYDLLSAMYIVPIQANPIMELWTVVKLVWKDRLPLTAVRNVLQPDRKSQKEKQIVDLAQQETLSVPEIIRCVELGVDKLPRTDSIMEILYTDSNTTSDNIAAQVKSSTCTQEITLAVANLYLRQQILFERV